MEDRCEMVCGGAAKLGAGGGSGGNPGIDLELRKKRW